MLLDVREEQEWNLVHIEGAKLLPLSSFDPAKLDSVKKTDHIITYCHHGMRSLDALSRLQSAGFLKVQSMSGGIDVWAETIEPNMPRY